MKTTKTSQASITKLAHALHAMIKFKHYYPRLYRSMLTLLGIQEDPFEDGIPVCTFKKRLKELSNAVTRYDKCEVSFWFPVRGKRWIRVEDPVKGVNDLLRVSRGQKKVD